VWPGALPRHTAPAPNAADQRSSALAKGPLRTLRSRAIALLARREYSRAELRARLVRHRDAAAEQGDEDIDALLDTLAADGFLSDARFAQSLVRRKAGTHSRRAIAGELRAQGVAQDTLAEAIAGSELDDDVTMRALWERRFGEPPRDEREKARQVRFLQSRGFGLSAILRFLRSSEQGT